MNKLFSKRGSPSKRDVVEGVEEAVAQGQAAVAQGQAAYTELKDEAEAKVEEAKALQAAYSDDKVPPLVKVTMTLNFLKGPIATLLGFIWKVLCCLLPLYQKLFALLYELYQWLPVRALQMVFGAVLCFFGGTYLASLAAIEAFKTMGGERLWSDLVYVYEQMVVVNEANKKDEEASGASTLELLNEGPAKQAEVAQRKLYVVMTSITQPGRLENAVGSLWSAYVAVLATLSLQFAQVAALALGMASTVRPLVSHFVTPLLEYVLDAGLHHWISTLLNTTLNLLAMYVAWSLMAVVAAVYSGLRGGRLFADALFGLLEDYKVVEYIPETCRETFRPWLKTETSLLDELIMYALAAAGIYSQVFSGFAIFFPLNYVLMPLSAVEWFLRFQVTFGGAAPGSSATG
jgi:hypothetical protein